MLRPWAWSLLPIFFLVTFLCFGHSLPSSWKGSNKVLSEASLAVPQLSLRMPVKEKSLLQSHHVRNGAIYLSGNLSCDVITCRRCRPLAWSTLPILLLVTFLCFGHSCLSMPKGSNKVSNEAAAATPQLCSSMPAKEKSLLRSHQERNGAIYYSGNLSCDVITCRPSAWSTLACSARFLSSSGNFVVVLLEGKVGGPHGLPPFPLPKLCLNLHFE